GGRLRRGFGGVSPSQRRSFDRFFFFSSRRRHTRSKRDWSSDVCSSDLQIPSPATIARLLASVGHVDASPKKRPKSSYIPFVRATAMSLWQLDAFEYDLSHGQTVTIYQLLDDSTRFDVGTTAHVRAENSTDAKSVLADAIAAHGAPQEVLRSEERRVGREGT